MLAKRRWWIASSFAACVALAAPTVAAQDAGGDVSPTGKGIAGGILLGGEVAMLTEAAIGVKPAWAYLVGGVAGAAGGGVGGYYAEQQSSAKLSLYLLAGGMALAIPTTIAVLSRTAYDPPVEFTQDAPPADEPVAEPPAPADTLEEAPVSGAIPRRQGRGSPAPPTALMASHPIVPRLPPALLGLSARRVVLAVPGLELRDVFTASERQVFGVRSATEVRISVVSGSF